MYSIIAAQHAQQLVAAGVDFVVVDMTSARPKLQCWFVAHYPCLNGWWGRLLCRVEGFIVAS